MTSNEQLRELFKELFDRYYEDAVTWLQRKGVDRETARDLAQDAFVRVFRGLKGFRGEHPWPWIQPIVKHTWINWLRSKGTKKRAGIEQGFDQIPEPREGDVQSPWVRRERRPDHKAMDQDRFSKAFGSMPERTRQVAVLRFRDGLTNKEIARLLGVSIDTIKDHVKKARVLLQVAFSEPSDEEPDDGQ